MRRQFTGWEKIPAKDTPDADGHLNHTKNAYSSMSQRERLDHKPGRDLNKHLAKGDMWKANRRVGEVPSHKSPRKTQINPRPYKSGKTQNSITHQPGVGGHNGAAISKTACWLLTKLNTSVPCDPAVVLLGIYPKG